MKKLNIFQKTACVLAGIIIFVSIWKFSLYAGLINELLLPSPEAIILTVIEFFKSSRFWVDLLSTIGSWTLGTVIGTFLGGIFGLILSLNIYVWAAFEPWIEFFRSLPSIVLVPLISIFVGVGVSSRLVCSSLVVFLLMVSTAASAIFSTRNSYLRLALTWNLKKFQRLKWFYIPGTLSHLAIALKAAIPIALIVTIAADMLIATESGIGKILMDSYAVFDTKKFYAAVLVVGILGYIAAKLSSILEHRTLHWRGE